MKEVSELNQILAQCRSCGNTGLQNIVAQYNQDIIDYCDGEPDCTYEYKWILLECPVCSSISLYQRYTGDHMIDYDGNHYYEEKIIYPNVKSFPNVPEDIYKSYEAAVKTAKVDLSVSMIAIRAVLEKICKERGTNRKNLESMLKQMVEKNILPDTLDKCGFIIRKMGNNGAHGDNVPMLTTRDVAELIDFLETIMYYIYELPIKVDKLNRKYELKLDDKKTSLE